MFPPLADLLPEDRQPVIIAARRSAIGRAGGIFGSLDVEDPAAPVMTATLADANVAPDQLDDVILGNAAGPGGNIARLSALHAEFPTSIPGVTVDRQCGSGLESVMIACHLIMAGAGTTYLAGGVESQSRAPLRTLPASGTLPEHSYTRARFAPEAIGDPEMGAAADTVAQQFKISRERQDAFALRSQQRAVQARDEAEFDAEIVPIAGHATDECIRDTMTAERLARLRPAFGKDGTVTVGNACPLNDGAATVLVTTAQHARTLGHKKALAYLGGASAGVDPNILGIGPVASTQKLLRQRPNLSLVNLTHLEFNEAFASQVLASLDALNIPGSLPNQHGGAIALGHPIGATGSILVGTMLDELERQDKQFGLVTMCAAGGMAPAIIIERV